MFIPSGEASAPPRSINPSCSHDSPLHPEQGRTDCPFQNDSRSIFPEQKDSEPSPPESTCAGSHRTDYNDASMTWMVWNAANIMSTQFYSFRWTEADLPLILAGEPHTKYSHQLAMEERHLSYQFSLRLLVEVHDSIYYGRPSSAI